MDENRLLFTSEAVLAYYSDPANHFSSDCITNVERALAIIKERCIGTNLELNSDLFDNLDTSDLSQFTKNVVRHVCAMLSGVDKKGRVKYVYARPHIPLIAALKSTEFRESLSNYSEYQFKLGVAKETVHQKGLAIRDFLVFLESLNITELNQITRDHIHYYCNVCLSSYKETTRVAIIYRIRQFVLRMIILGKINDSTIINAFESSHRFARRMVTVLTDVQRREILSKKNPKTASEARDLAAGLLCMVLGLRRSDAYGLKFENVDWKRKRIHLIQRKTNYPLELPLPDIVGNALATYILQFRSESDSEYIFLSLKAPYLPYANPQGLVGRLLGKGKAASDEHHILRRTCATNLMNWGIEPLTIMGLLGQCTTDSLDRYLSLNEEAMSNCSIDLSFIGLPEIMK